MTNLELADQLSRWDDLTSQEQLITARQHVADIRSHAGEWWSKVQLAWEQEHWRALNYNSFEAYVKAEDLANDLAANGVKLTVGSRRAAVLALSKAGLSQRAIGAATGVSKATVNSDLAPVGQKLDNVAEAAGQKLSQTPEAKRKRNSRIPLTEEQKAQRAADKAAKHQKASDDAAELKRLRTENGRLRAKEAVGVTVSSKQDTLSSADPDTSLQPPAADQPEVAELDPELSVQDVVGIFAKWSEDDRRAFLEQTNLLGQFQAQADELAQFRQEVLEKDVIINEMAEQLESQRPAISQQEFQELVALRSANYQQRVQLADLRQANEDLRAENARLAQVSP